MNTRQLRQETIWLLAWLSEILVNSCATSTYIDEYFIHLVHACLRGQISSYACMPWPRSRMVPNTNTYSTDCLNILPPKKKKKKARWQLCCVLVGFTWSLQKCFKTWHFWCVGDEQRDLVDTIFLSPTAVLCLGLRGTKHPILRLDVYCTPVFGNRMWMYDRGEKYFY